MSHAELVTVDNPFEMERSRADGPTAALVSVEQQRAIAEIQAMSISAKSFPRSQHQSMVRILEECKRRQFAEIATYSYPRGRETVSGPSIRLAEVMAQNWGNLIFGLRELERIDGKSVMQAYCWDIETNVRDVREFTVRHIRNTKKGSYELTDERDIYELCANMGARRKRAAILAVIPRHVQEAALKQCRETIKHDIRENRADHIQKIVTAFYDRFAVTAQMIEEYLGHPIDQTDEDEIADLRGIYSSIKDGAAKKSDFFGPKSNDNGTEPGDQSGLDLNGPAEEGAA